MLKQHTVTIGETDFIIEQLPTTKGLEVAFAIAQILKGIAEGVSEEFVLNFAETKVNIGKSLAGLIACSDAKETPEFIKQLVVMSVKKPEMIEGDFFEDHFASNYIELSDLLAEIISFNGFNDLVKKNLSKLTEQLQQ